MPRVGSYYENAELVAPIRLQLPASDAALLRVIRELVAEWSDAQHANVQIVEGGITNALYKLSASGRPSVLVRIYGHNTSVVIDREAENRLFASLSRAGFAPTYFGRFDNGRVEGFLEGYRALEPHEMGLDSYRSGIAARLRQMHALDCGSDEPTLYRTLARWMEAAGSVRFDDARATRHAALDLSRHEALLTALTETHDDRVGGFHSAGAREALRPSLCHNDLLSGNILVHPDTGDVRLIDYEYGACSYPAFDIANHFCEYAGFDSDFDTQFPSPATRRAFIEAYLGPGFDDRDVDEFGAIVEQFILADHLFWGTWAVIQARWSSIDFDFLGYAELRLGAWESHGRTLGIWPLEASG